MAPVTVYIVSLLPSTELSVYLKAFEESKIKPILFGRVIQWIVTPTIAEHLLRHNWDFMIVLPTGTSIPSSVSSLAAHTFSIRIDQDDEMLSNVLQNNDSFIHPKAIGPTHNLDRPLIANSNQKVELSPALLAFARSPLCPEGPVSMLNFIAFHPFASAKTAYASYIDGFKASVGTKRGGLLKIYGATEEMGIWDSVALAQYPSLEHFADMAADPEYQALNQVFRLPALRDTCILMTSEVQLDWDILGSSLS